jgi:SMI1-KNR4 cell-wall
VVLLRDPGPVITGVDIRRFEETYRLRFPDDYKAQMLMYNGGQPERDLFAVVDCEANPIARVHYFFGIGYPMECYDLGWNYDVFNGRIPNKLIPIATTEGADQICLCVRGPDYGSVVYWDGYAESRQRIFSVADTFYLFCSMLFRDEHSPS